MTYIEWMDELKKNLLSLPREEQERVSSYFSEIYADKRDAGFSEKQIIAEFGPPYDAAKRVLGDEFNQQYPRQSAPREENFPQGGNSFFGENYRPNDAGAGRRGAPQPAQATLPQQPLYGPQPAQPLYGPQPAQPKYGPQPEPEKKKKVSAWGGFWKIVWICILVFISCAVAYGAIRCYIYTVTDAIECVAGFVSGGVSAGVQTLGVCIMQFGGALILTGLTILFIKLVIKRIKLLSAAM